MRIHLVLQVTRFLHVCPYLAGDVLGRGGEAKLLDGPLDVGDRLPADLHQRLHGSASHALELRHERLLEDSSNAGLQGGLGVVDQASVNGV